MSTKTLEMPERIAKLPVNEKGFPVPWFVAWIEGKPDFRCMDAEKLGLAVREKRCWICGEPLGKYKTFVIGPMCAVNRISAEPPSHRECALYAVQACPFLATPKMHRNEKNMPEHDEPAGTMIKRNPGVALVWVTRGYELIRLPEGVLFRIGEPVEKQWFSEGRPAEREEILASLESGYPLLEEPARAEGPKALAELNRLYEAVLADLIFPKPGYPGLN